MAKKAVEISFDEDILSKLDNFVAKGKGNGVKLNRSSVVNRACQQYIDEIEKARQAEDGFKIG